jgi:hypothetical protein
MHIGRIRNGVILISGGVVLLLNTLEQLPWTVWIRIFSFWPVFLIAFGIELLFKKTKLSFLSILSPLLFLLVILGPALFFETGVGKIHRTQQVYLWSQDLDSNLTRATAIIELRTGNLRLSSGTDKLVSTELDYFERKPLVSYKHINSDSSATVEITDSERSHWGWSLNKGWSWDGWEKKDWEIRLTDRIPINLNIDTKASRTDLDLSELKINNFNLEAKATNVDIKIGDLVNELVVRVDASATKLSISLPEGMGLRIENHSTLSSTSFSWLSLKGRDNIFETPNYEEASHKLTLYLDGSVIKLKIKQYQPLEGI